MSFAKLYRDLCNQHPVGNLTKTTEKIDYFDERMEVMNICGMGPNTDKSGGGGGAAKKMNMIRAEKNKHHGKDARQRAPAARLKALNADNGVVAVKRLAIARAVNDVTKTFEVSKQLGTFVKNKKPFPPKLMRELLGADAMRPKEVNLSPLSKKKPIDFGPTDHKTLPKEPVRLKQIVATKWLTEERDYLNKLYEEVERPTARNQSLWAIYYRNMYSRFKPFYPDRSFKEVRDKIVEMIQKRQFKTTTEREYWANAREVKERERVMLANHGSPEKEPEYYNIVNDITGPGGQSVALNQGGSISNV